VSVTPKTARAIRDAVAAGETSAVEVCRQTLDAIRALDPPLNAFRSVAAERALARAAELDSRSDRSPLPLLGVPIALKDNICTRGIPTTASSRILEGYVPP
jgi:aspartyl-tRNA(Asn)/glutamyl-tRNA(Gln) amidotransferase subunit A